MNRKRVRQVLFVAVATLPSAANAQVPVYPSGAIPQPPVNLDPSASGSQAPPPPAPVVQQPSQPNVIVVKPDGSVTQSSDSNAAPSGYFIDNNAPTGIMNPENEPAQVSSGPVPELHVVRSGDTLWDICTYYFNDPWQWPKIWSYNPQITNPHWIYPGDLVRLLPRGQFAQQPINDTAKAATAPDTKPADNIPPPAKRIGVGLQQAAFVEKSDLDKSITIDGSVDEKVLLGRGDAVYLSYPSNNPPEVGKTYSIYVPDNEVHTNGKDYGSYVRLLGSLRVESVKQDKRARAIITDSNMEIQRGSKVGPLLKEFSTVPNVPPKVDLQGNIVAMLTRERLIGQGELVFIDQGQSSGIEVGNRMYVVRRGDAYPGHAQTTIGQDDRRFPARALGQIVVVEVGDKISVGLVTLSVQEMGVGDVVTMQTSSQ
jgi:LysM domain